MSHTAPDAVFPILAPDDVVISGDVTPNSSAFFEPSPEVDAGDDVAPLVRAARLHPATVAPVQLHEIVGLQDHVIEFEKAQRLIAVEAQLHAVHRQHAIDRHVPADLAQERHIFQTVEPVGVVDHDRIGRPAPERDEPLEHAEQALLVAFDLCGREQLAHLVLARRIADLRRAAAHHHDRLVARLLEPAKRHDLHQVADMETWSRAVESDIGRDAFLLDERIEAFEVRALMQLAARRDEAEKFGTRAHDVIPLTFGAKTTTKPRLLNTVSRLFKVIGLMSGTSLDGVDGAFLTTDGETVAEPGPALTFPYGADTRAKLHAALVAARSLTRGLPVPPEIDAAERVLTEAHVDLVAHLLAQAQLEPSDVDYIGFHGQTVLHRAHERWTWQIGDGAELARATGIAVVNDFRSADVAAGGQGAPFVPLYHLVLARSQKRPLVVVNIGGVANVTYVGADDEVIAFDTGPGNAALDDWVHAQTGEPYDVDGKLARARRRRRETARRDARQSDVRNPTAEIARSLRFSDDPRRRPLGAGRRRDADRVHRGVHRACARTSSA